MTCDVCGRERETTVASSVLGPFSFAYCHECLLQDAEPLDMWYSTFDVVGPNNIREDLKTFGSFKDGKYVTFSDVVSCYTPGEIDYGP